jgi:hypothetical protein
MCQAVAAIATVCRMPSSTSKVRPALRDRIEAAVVGGWRARAHESVDSRRPPVIESHTANEQTTGRTGTSGRPASSNLPSKSRKRQAVRKRDRSSAELNGFVT